MKHFSIFIFGLLFAFSAFAIGPKGVKSVSTTKSVDKIVKEAKEIFQKKGITLFAVVDHQKGAKSAGVKLGPTVTMIFGKPKLGAPLMKAQRSIALDLPLKLLVYREGKTTYIVYNSIDYLQNRHHLGDLPELKKIEKALDSIASELGRAQ